MFLISLFESSKRVYRWGRSFRVVILYLLLVKQGHPKIRSKTSTESSFSRHSACLAFARSGETASVTQTQKMSDSKFPSLSEI